MESSHHLVPQLAEITRHIEGISPVTKVTDVIDIFRRDPSLLALPVIEEGKFRGVINRRTLFFCHLGKQYAMDLYGNKPIRILLDENHCAMEAKLDINSALARLLEFDPELAGDSFPVVDGEMCWGIVAVSTLMMKISQTQAILFQALDKLEARLREEVSKGSKIQQDLLPPAEFNHGGISISAGVVTSTEIGGDFFDYFVTDDGYLGLLVADVSGHGVQSGMVTTAAKASLHTLISHGVTTPAELLLGMNKAILATARQTLLMTCLIALIDLNKGEVSIANAGHNFPYIFRSRTGTLEMIENVAGFPLGFDEDFTYEEMDSRFNNGDRLVLYTDGIVECRNGEGEEFGYDRLEAFLREHIDNHPNIMKKQLMDMIVNFTGTTLFEDDVTLIIASFQTDGIHTEVGEPYA